MTCPTCGSEVKASADVCTTCGQWIPPGQTVSMAPEFVALVNARLTKGEVEYADQPAIDRPLMEVVNEIEQEFADVVGWGYMGWRKVQRLKRTLTGGMR